MFLLSSFSFSQLLLEIDIIALHFSFLLRLTSTLLDVLACTAALLLKHGSTVMGEEISGAVEPTLLLHGKAVYEEQDYNLVELRLHTPVRLL